LFTSNTHATCARLGVD
jgi:hypothetical protein